MLWQYDEEKIQMQNTKSVKIGKLNATFVYSEQKQRSVSKDNQWRPVICPQVGIQLIYASGWLLIGQFVPAALASSAYIQEYIHRETQPKQYMNFSVNYTSAGKLHRNL